MPLDSPIFRACAMALSALALSACDTPPTQVDQYFGLSVQQAQMQQTQNLPMNDCPMRPYHSACAGPRHGGGHDPLRGAHRAARDSDGEVALSAIQRYQESFASPMGSTTGTSLGTGPAIKR